MFFTFSQRLIQGASAIYRLLQLDSKIRLDLGRADIRTTIAAMFCLMTMGIDTESSISLYLAEHNSHFDRDTIEFLLAQYLGSDPKQHLWEQDYLGTYHPLDVLLTEYQLPVSKYD